MVRRLYLLASLVLAFALACSVSLQAQSIFGEIHGTVQDATGAVVPNAQITLKDNNSGAVRRSVTNSDGYYAFASVPVGKYTLLVEAKGFRSSQVEGIEVTGSSSQTFLNKLTVSAESTSVEVTGVADTIIPTDSGEKATVLQERQLQDYNVVSRNAAEFIKVLPGFVNSGSGVQSGSSFGGEVIGINGGGDAGQQSPLAGGYVAMGVGTQNTGVNGATMNIDITSDGAHVSDPGCNCATPVNPNTDMIQEFQVLTSNFGADNAKGPVVINSITKSGGRNYHGEAYIYARDYALNANRWINNFTHTPQPGNKFFFPGGNIGGPVLIPHSNFNKNRDKMFFFSGFEYYKQTLDTGLLSDTVPTSGMRNGDFSPTELATLGAKTAGGGAPSQLNTCLTGIGNNNLVPATCHDNSGKPNTYWGGLVTTIPGAPAPMPGGVIPSNLLDASGAKFLNLFPSPNANPNADGGYNYLKNVVFDQNMWQWNSKVDYNISDNTKLYVRYNLQKETQKFPVGLWWRNANQVPYPTPILGKNRSDSVSASLIKTFSPTLSNEFVFGYTYIDFPNVFQDKRKVSKNALGIPFNGLWHNGVDQIPSLTGWGGEFATMLNPSGFQIGGSDGLFAKKYMPSITDNLTKVWGTHTLKFGFYFEYTINNQPSNNNANGRFVQAGWAGGSSGNPYADLLGGFAGQYTETNKDVLHNEAYKQTEFFAQDSWKVTRRLSVDYGLRFSHLGNWYDREGNGFAVFNSALYDPAASINSGTGFDWHSKNHNVSLSGFPNKTFNYAPRFGLAYDVLGTGKTVLRGGWGEFIYHNAQFTQGLDQPLGVQEPTLNSVNVSQIQSTGGSAQPFNPQGVLQTDDNAPRTQSYSFTISQRVPFSSLLEVAYVGNDTKYLLNGNGVGTNINIVPVGALLNAPFDPSKQNSGGNPSEYQYAAPYKIYQNIAIARHNLSGNYNSLQVSWVRNKGAYDLNFNYVLSKALGIFGQTNEQDFGRALYTAQSFDRRHVFNAAYSINLPSPIHGNKALGGVANGWQLSGITQVQSGVNLTGNSTNGNFNASGNISNSLTVQNVWNSSITAFAINGTDQMPLEPILTCDPRKGLHSNQYVNGNCFAIPTVPGHNGPLVLPEIFGPWWWNSDLAMFKNFQLTESKKLQFRFSAFNFLNHSVPSFTGSGAGSSALNLNFGPGGSGQMQTNLPNGQCTNTSQQVGGACGFGYAPIKVGNRILELALKFYF